MDNQAFLTLLIALKIEFGLLFIFALGLRFGLAGKLGRFWRNRILLGLLALTVVTLLMLFYASSGLKVAGIDS